MRLLTFIEGSSTSSRPFSDKLLLLQWICDRSHKTSASLVDNVVDFLLFLNYTLNIISLTVLTHYIIYFCCNRDIRFFGTLKHIPRNLQRMQKTGSKKWKIIWKTKGFLSTHHFICNQATKPKKSQKCNKGSGPILCPAVAVGEKFCYYQIAFVLYSAGMA